MVREGLSEQVTLELRLGRAGSARSGIHVTVSDFQVENRRRQTGHSELPG